MNLPIKISADSLADSEILAKDFSKSITKGVVVVLNGNLGSGKTTLIKLICKEYGISNVNSPSFSIVNEYFGEYKIYHFDFYRIKKEEELFDIGFEEYLNDSDSISFIEWGNLFPDLIPKNHLEIKIKIVDSNRREFDIIKHD